MNSVARCGGAADLEQRTSGLLDWQPLLTAPTLWPCELKHGVQCMIDERFFQSIQTRELTLRVRVEGQGPLCVLVHGFPESWYSFRHQITALTAAGYRTAALDVRGYGGSDCPSEVAAYSMESLTADIADVVDALGEEPAILIGHDWGAPQVWQTALRYPDKVRAVVGLSVPYLGRGPAPLIDVLRAIYADRFFYQIYFQTPGVAEAEFEADIEGCLRKLYVGGSAQGIGQQRGFSAYPELRDTMFGPVPYPQELPPWLRQEDLDYYVAQFQRSGFAGPIHRYRNSERDFARSAALQGAQITQPALFITGALDEVMHFIPGRRLHDHMDAHYADLRGKHEIDNAGHWVQQEQPAEVNKRILAFLAAL